MSRIAMVGLIGLSVFAVEHIPTRAATQSEAYAGAICLVDDPTGTPLNIRKFPQSTIVGSLPNGESVAIRETARDHKGKLWARITHNKGGNHGWVFLAYLDCASSTTKSHARAPRSNISERYPVVFTRAADLRRLGLVVLGFTEDSGLVRDLRIHCYYYGDGGYNLSISDEFLRRFKARAFSRRSLCMALLSGVKYDPENGRRLPTYILGLVEKVRRNAGQPEDAGDVSQELPLDVPNCFRNGVPYTDCEMRFDPMTGARLSSGATQEFKKIGLRIERKLADPNTRRAFKYVEESSTPVDTIFVGAEPCVCYEEFSGGADTGAASFYDYSDEFPKGFGYALYADGAAGPDPSAEAVRLSLDPNRRATETKIRELEALLKR